MGISEIEALALILGGAYLVGHFFTEDVKLTAGVVLLLGGLAMMIFGLLDIAVDHL